MPRTIPAGTLRSVQARPQVPVRPELVGFSDRPYRHRLGLRTTTPDRWLDVDAARSHDIAAKEDRLSREPERIRVGGSSRADRLVGEALADAAGTDVEGDDLLLAVGRTLQEDVVVLERLADGWHFTSGLVCFPTAWEPAEKLGQAVLAIHRPVPGYAEQIGAAVDRYLERLGVGDVQWRRNWSLVATDALWVPPGGVDVTPADVGTDVFLRIERQTFRKVAPDVIVFGIRIHRWTMDEALAPDAARGLATQIRTMPDGYRAYKELLATHTEPLLDWLDGRAAAA
jgi:hypothetical protein